MNKILKSVAYIIIWTAYAWTSMYLASLAGTTAFLTVVGIDFVGAFASLYFFFKYVD